MLFIPPVEVNAVWATVARATAAGELGIAAKVAPHPAYGEDRARLVCVYTADFSDKGDVARVLGRMRQLGLVKAGGMQIYYKAGEFAG